MYVKGCAGRVHRIHHYRFLCPLRNKIRGNSGGAPDFFDSALFAQEIFFLRCEVGRIDLHTLERSMCMWRIVKPSATPVQNTLHKAFSTANICAGGCSMPTPLSQYIYQNTAQCPDVSGNIPVAGRWCSRSSRVATADTTAESIFLPSASATTTRRGALAQALLATVAQPLLAAFHSAGVVEAARVNATVDGDVADSVRATFMAQTVLDLLRR